MNTTVIKTQPIFRWNGQYFGYMANGYLFDRTGAYRGWIDHDGSVWQATGKFLGELVGGEYVLLQQSANRPNQPKRLTPSAVPLPAPSPDRPARGPRAGYTDGLAAAE